MRLVQSQTLSKIYCVRMSPCLHPANHDTRELADNQQDLSYQLLRTRRVHDMGSNPASVNPAFPRVFDNTQLIICKYHHRRILGRASTWTDFPRLYSRVNHRCGCGRNMLPPHLHPLAYPKSYAVSTFRQYRLKGPPRMVIHTRWNTLWGRIGTNQSHPNIIALEWPKTRDYIQWMRIYGL